jgi:Rieske Fe-S protein
MAIDVISRRSALGGVAVTAVAAVVGYFVARRSDAARAKGVTTAANGRGAGVIGGARRLASAEQVPVGRGLILSGEQIVLTRDAGGVVHGFSAVCTHQGCTVDSIVDGAIGCPCHGSRFDAATGAVLVGPAARALPGIPVTVRDGAIYRN